MAVPQLGAILGGKTNPANTIGYQPTNRFGQQFNPPALIFHYEGEQTATLESDITDHWAEDNTSLQDQIALKPVVITTHGFIGELTDTPPNALIAALQVAANKLLLIEGLTPALTVSAIEAYNQATFAYSAISTLANSAVSAFGAISGLGVSGEAVVTQAGISNTEGSAQGKQQIMFQQFYGYWTNRTLFTVQTPWAVFTNMAIKSLRAIQDADTNVITDFELQFKMMRFSSLGVDSNEVSNIKPAIGSRLDYQTQSDDVSNVALSGLARAPSGYSGAPTI